jgi:opacity protein-like surface antigen
VAPRETRGPRSVYVAARAGGFIPTGKEFGAHPTIGDGGPWRTEFKTGMDLELGAGVRLSPRFSLEAAVGLHQSAAELSESSIFVGGTSYYGTERLELGVTSYTASVRFAPDAGMPMYVLFGAGIYSAKLEDRFTANGGSEWTASYSDSPFGFHFGMGFFYPVSRNLRLEVEGGFNYAKPQFGGVESDVGALRFAVGASYGL